MKAVILAGGLGTRILEESHLKPKPMIEIGGKPLLWHIMKTYSHHGINDFIVCLGYKGYVIKEYFANYFLHMSDVTFDLQNNSIEVHEQHAEPWRVTLVDTGADTMTGGRLKRVRNYLLYLRRWPVKYRHQAGNSLPPRARKAGDGSRGAAAGTLRRADPQR
jgi:glucose-1-phosphate cytidylyltransferase